MAKYFAYFPQVTFDGVPVRDITRRTKILDNLKNQPYVFLPYTVSENDRPEDIAHLYYGSVDYTWLVRMANNILDPLVDWPKTTDAFYDYLIAKYKVQANTDGTAVVAWTQQQVKHYVNTSDDTIISPDTYAHEDSIDVGQWSSLSVYDWEHQRNSDKRHIHLVNKIYAKSLTEQLRQALASNG